MNGLQSNDDTWEDFFGSTTDLSPVIDVFDAKLQQNRHKNFNLSPCVQKILSHVIDGDDDKNKEDNNELQNCLKFDNNHHLKRHSRSFKLSTEKLTNKSTESLDIISPNVQKMISNFPDTELVINNRNCNNNNNSGRNHSFLHNRIYLKDNSDNKRILLNNSDCDRSDCVYEENSTISTTNNNNDYWNCNNSKPLGTYLHSSKGIASRNPVGRKNMGKFLQVPSESSAGTTNSTISSSTEVSRPVSLTSLGSCSSSGSSGPNQPSSAYLASAESLDSDPEPTGSQGSADSGIAEQSLMSPEVRVLQEVLDTETVYVSDLGQVIEGYLKPWQHDPDGPLYQYLSTLFSNLEEIYQFNRSFLGNLREADCDPTKIANVFIQNTNGFVVYNEYCTNYPKTMEILGELIRNENISALFRERQLALGHALPLGSYLLKPVQRILKYHLLLQRLSKQCCETQHKSAVDLALTTMTAVASNINNMKRKHEHAVRVHEIQSQLYGWSGPDLTALGELIAEGTFRVNGARGRRHVFLFDKVLLMAKNKQDGALAYKSHIMCSNLMLVEQVRGEPLSFQVIPFDNPRLQCTLRARSPQHKREWTLQIKRVILENYSAVIPNHARQLVMQLGQDVQETEDVDKWSPLNKNSSTPHYLERRSRVRKTRDLSNRRASSQDRSFPSLGSWRRKSEPGIIQQYTTKTLPKKIAKIKKVKESCAKFYTDLYDDDEDEDVDLENNCGNNHRSNESLETSNNSINDKTIDDDDDDDEEDDEDIVGTQQIKIENNLEKIVSDLLMQNQEFNRVMNKPRRNSRNNSEPETMKLTINNSGVGWFEQQKLPNKADSLPRSFQLNDQLETTTTKDEKQSIYETVKEDVDRDEQPDNDLSSQLDDQEHPVHKIYRKTAIRFSLVQRIRALVSEDEKLNTRKYPLRKQGSKSMGEKIAHPDYVDPQKLFPTVTTTTSMASINTTCSQTNLIEDCVETSLNHSVEQLDMTICEDEVLGELEKRLNDNNNHVNSSRENDENQNPLIDNHNNESSLNTDGYYERILDDNLIEEYVKDANGKLVAKQDSFRSNNYTITTTTTTTEQDNVENLKNTLNLKTNLKRPTKPPPPIPVKPARLLNNSSTTTTIRQKIVIKNECNNEGGRTTSWVKTMVGRFE